MALVVTAFGSVAGLNSPAAAAPRSVTISTVANDWPVYHHDASGSGTDTSGVSFTGATPATLAWGSPVLDGTLYSEPLEATGRVFMATENDTVYAFAANNGSVLWSQHLATPVPADDLTCSNVRPTVGITSTPVIDRARGEIFVIADELVDGGPQHWMVALNIYSGAVLWSQRVDPPGVDPAAALNRASLNLADGNVIFGYGGNAGDCGVYHGWIGSTPETGGPPAFFELDNTAPGQIQGAIWMGGAAPEVDTSGDIWAAAGNGSVVNCSDTYDDSDSVFKLGPALNLLDYFAPSTWCTDNISDFDLGSSPPALLSNGTVLQVGKSQTAYLLDRNALGGIGGQLASDSPLCGDDVDGGHAISGTTVYEACVDGIEALETSNSPPSVSVLWQTPTDAWGPPILAGGLVWTVGPGGLLGLDPATGDQRFVFNIGGEATDFPTPAVGDGLLLVASTNQVYALSGSLGIPGPPSPPPYSSYWMVASDGGLFSYGGAKFYGSMGGKQLVAPIVGMAPTADGQGYWEVAADGGLFSFGDARYYGSMGGKKLVAPIVGVASTADGQGYWEVAADGGLFCFGDATFQGSMGGKNLVAPIVGMAPTADGQGYWEVASDGGLFSFGDAQFQGSMGGKQLVAPIVGMSATADGHGYWEVASDGGLFSFGDARFSGSMGGKHLVAPVVSLVATTDGQGYWEVASDGGLFPFGDAQFSGSQGSSVLVAPIVGSAIPPYT
jgi:hypothetical protein